MAFGVTTDGRLVGPGNRRTLQSFSPTGIPHYAADFTVAYQTLYRCQPALRTVIDFIARNMASLPIKMAEVDADGDLTQVLAHPLLGLLRRPTPRVTQFEFIRDAVADVCLFDRYVALKLRAGDTRRLVHVPAPLWRPKSGNGLQSDEIELFPGTASAQLWPRDDAILISGYSPDGSDAEGVAPAETLRATLAEEMASTDARRDVWKRGPRMSGFIKRPVEAPPWAKGAKERFVTEVRAHYAAGGGNSGGMPLLEDGMEIEAFTTSSQEMEYVAVRQLNRREVLATYHMDPSLLGMENSGGEGTSAARKNVYADSFGPYAAWFGQRLELELLSEFGLADDGTVLLSLDLEAKLLGHFTDLAEVLSRSVGAPWLTRNEARRISEKPAIEGGDELITPLNVVIGGRASPADTAPGTPGAGQASAGIEIPVKARAMITKAGRLHRDMKALPAAKAGEAFSASLRPWVGVHEQVIGAWIKRHRRSVLQAIEGGALPADAIDPERWAKELGDDAFGVALAMAPEASTPVMVQLGSDEAYNVAGAEAWLQKNATIYGSSVSATLEDDLAAAWAAPATDDLPTPSKRVGSIYEKYLAGRLSWEAVSRTVTVGNFVRHDSAQQVGAGTKTWIVRSGNPRSSHASLDRVTVAMGDTFANGGKWPGDPALPSDERANCTCEIEFGQ